MVFHACENSNNSRTMQMGRLQTSYRALAQNKVMLYIDAVAFCLFLARDPLDLPHGSCSRSYPRSWRGSAHGCLLLGVCWILLRSVRVENSLMNTNVNAYELLAIDAVWLPTRLFMPAKGYSELLYMGCSSHTYELSFPLHTNNF